MCWLCPISTPGTPGTVTPLTCRPGAEMAAWYQIDGSVCGRCGPPASMAPCPSTTGPFAAQALLSGSRCTSPAGSRLVWASRSTAAAPTADDDELTGSPGEEYEVM